ncbi:MAG: HEAT repeat domain-containing protein [Gemmatimonas sp.]
MNDIATLVMLEDQRHYDADELSRMLKSSHPEVRERAAVSVGRINDKRGIVLLRARPLDSDTAVAASTVFAVGQLRDTTTIAWFDSLLSSPTTPPTVLSEAATALGKIKTVDARNVLGRFLAGTSESTRTNAAIGEALLSIGRASVRGEPTPIIKFARSANAELRWRATWALFRQRDPVALEVLLELSDDPVANVRVWAVRGLTKSQADTAGLIEKAHARLMTALGDHDRAVRTEAVRTIATFTDPASVSALVVALKSADSWISVSAAEGLGRARDVKTIRDLVAATGAKNPCALRITAMQALAMFSPATAITAAIDIARDPTPYCQQIAMQTIARDTTGTAANSSAAAAAIGALKSSGSITIRTQAWQAHYALTDASLDVAAKRAARRVDVQNADDVARAAAIRTMTSWADTSDIAVLLDLYDKSQNIPSALAAPAAVSVLAAIQRRQTAGASEFFARFSPPSAPLLRRDIDRAFGALARQSWPEAPRSVRPLADYVRVVERWVVPDYNGLSKPQARWQTARGAIDIELYPGDAPLAVDDFVRTMNSGAIIGTEFTRVVPDFVDQQRTIKDANTLRDEVNRRGLTRGNLAWATAGLDTGAPGYTLGHTPQPHNEGDFTSMGRVIRGMDAVDRIELGDRITGGRMLQVRMK